MVESCPRYIYNTKPKEENVCVYTYRSGPNYHSE